MSLALAASGRHHPALAHEDDPQAAHLPAELAVDLALDPHQAPVDVAEGVSLAQHDPITRIVATPCERKTM